MTTPFAPQPCGADDAAATPCCSPGIASTGVCLADGTPIAVLAVSACGDCGGAAAAPEVSGWLNLTNGVFTPGAPPAGVQVCDAQQQFEVGQWCDIDAAGEVVAPVLVEYEYDDAGQLVGVRTLTPAGDPYAVTGALGLCPQPTGDTQYVELCDVQGDGTVVRFLRGFTPNGDGTATPDDITLDGAAYIPTGTVKRCEVSGMLAPVEFCFSDTVTVQRPGRVYEVDLPIAQGFGVESILVDLIEFPVPVIWGVNDPNGAQFAADLRAATLARFPGATVTVTPPAIITTCGDPEIFHVRIECLDLADDPPSLVQYRYNAGRDLISNAAFVTTPPTSNPSSGPHQLKRADNGGTLNCTSTANRGWETNDINGAFEWWGYANNPPGVSGLNASKATTPTPRATPVQEINAYGSGGGQPDTIWQTFGVVTEGIFNIRVVVGGRTGTENITIKLSTGDVNAAGAGDIINTVVSAGQVTNEGGATPGPWTTYANSVLLAPGLYTLAFTGPPVPGGASGGLFTDMRVYQDVPGQLINFATDDDTCTVEVDVTSTSCQLWAPVSVGGEIVRWHRMSDGLTLDNAAFWGQVPAPSCCVPGTAGGSTSAGNLIDSYQVCATVDGEQVTVQRVVITTQAGGTIAEQFIGPNGLPVTPSEWTPGACPPEESEPCASTVQTVRLCDMNPEVEPNGDGLRCATPFLRHLVFDCSGVLTGTHDTTMDGVTPYTPVQVVDCDCEGGGGRTAFVEVPWSAVSVAEDPDGTFAQDFIYTVSPDNDPDIVGTIHVHVSRAAGGACGAYDIDHLVFSNSATYTITLDPVAQGMSYLRVDLMDFDTFEPVGINGVRPDRLGGTAQWNGGGTRIIPTESNGVGYLYWDHPPETISYTIYNTGGGTSCSQLAFQGMSLEPGGCCDGESTAAAGVDVETWPLCVIDNASGNVLQHIRAEQVYDADGNAAGFPRLVDAVTGGPVPVPGGAHIGVCPQNAEPCRDSSSTLLCDISALETITVFDPANRPGSDGWEVVSFTGANADAPPEGALPYDAPHPPGARMGARSDLSAGTGGASWAGYDTAPVRWVLRKTFTAPEDGVASVTSVGFRGDGGARVRVNGTDAEMYGQWNQPATSGTAQIPVTAGPNVVEIEVRDVAGPNWVEGRLDIVLTRTEQFMRRTVVDCETGATVSVVDTTLSGEPYEVTGEVGQCQPVADCCEQPPPETRLDVETAVLCVRDTATGDIVAQVIAERVFDDQTGVPAGQRLTTLSGGEYELPDGAELVVCQPEPAQPCQQVQTIELCDRLPEDTRVRFLRAITRDCDGAVTSVTDTELDAVTPYTVAGEIGDCSCPSHLLTGCRCDDADGDGVGEVDYVELISVDGCTGTLTSLGTYLPDLSGPYTPVSPVECPVEGAPPGPVQVSTGLERVTDTTTRDLSAGYPLLQSVTLTVITGVVDVATSAGSGAVPAGVSLSWSITDEDDLAVTGWSCTGQAGSDYLLTWTYKA